VAQVHVYRLFCHR